MNSSKQLSLVKKLQYVSFAPLFCNALQLIKQKNNKSYYIRKNV